MNLAVEVKNVFNEKSEDVAVEILEASLLSKWWRLTGLAGGNALDTGPLRPRERAHLVLRARRASEELSDGKVDHSSIKIAKGHPDARHEVTVPPYSKFIMDYKPSYIDSPDKIFFEDGSKRTGLIQSMFILRWRARDASSGRSVVGQHCLWLDCFTKAQSREKDNLASDKTNLILDEYDSKLDLQDSKKNKKDKVVMFKMEHTQHVTHNFNERKLCIIPVTLNVVNCYGIPVKVFIDMSKQKNKYVIFL